VYDFLGIVGRFGGVGNGFLVVGNHFLAVGNRFLAPANEFSGVRTVLMFLTFGGRMPMIGVEVYG
jgi:hypothetical protein